MKLKMVLAAGLMAVWMSPALASNCPVLIQAIDEQLAEEAGSLSADRVQQITALRNEGEALHEAGDHDGSMSKLEEALELFAD
jgi:recombinational DNA repair ATPase RecF